MHLLAQLSTLYPLMMIECEELDEPDFLIGQVDEIAASTVDVQCVTGTGRWDDEPANVAYDNITSC